MTVHTVSFQQISKILEVTDALGLNREGVEIPLSPGRPGLVRGLSSGTLESIVDAEQPFDQWLMVLPETIQQAQRS
jgi:hypothetical protein